MALLAGCNDAGYEYEGKNTDNEKDNNNQEKAVCIENDVRCNDNTIVACKSNKWEEIKKCENQICSNGECVDKPQVIPDTCDLECVDGKLYCKNSDNFSVEICDCESDTNSCKGTKPISELPTSCDEGSYRVVCGEGEDINHRILTCDINGTKTKIHDIETCPYKCESGVCKEECYADADCESEPYCVNNKCTACQDGTVRIDNECVDMCSMKHVMSELNLDIDETSSIDEKEVFIIKDNDTMNIWRNNIKYESIKYLVFCGTIEIGSKFTSLPVTEGLKIVGVNDAIITSNNESIDLPLFQRLSNSIIKNIRFDNIRNNSNAVLSTSASNTKISNIAFNSITITYKQRSESDQYTSVGALIGEGNSVTIDNISGNIGEVSDLTSTDDLFLGVGGLIGIITGDSNIQNINLSINTVSGNNNIGGIIGFATTQAGFIKNANLNINNITIKTNEIKGSRFVGGVIGKLNNSLATIKNINNTFIKISSLHSFVGGFAGALIGNPQVITISSINNIGKTINNKDIEKEDISYAGGFTGWINGIVNIDSVRNIVDEVYANAYVGGFSSFIGCHAIDAANYSCNLSGNLKLTIHDIYNKLISVVQVSESSDKNTAGGFIGRFYLSPEHIPVDIHHIISDVKTINATSWVSGFIATMRMSESNVYYNTIQPHRIHDIYTSANLNADTIYNNSSKAQFIDRITDSGNPSSIDDIKNHKTFNVLSISNIVTDVNSNNHSNSLFDYIQNTSEWYHCENKTSDAVECKWIDCYGTECSNERCECDHIGNTNDSCFLNNSNCVIPSHIYLNNIYSTDGVVYTKDICSNNYTTACFEYTWSKNNKISNITNTILDYYYTLYSIDMKANCSNKNSIYCCDAVSVVNDSTRYVCSKDKIVSDGLIKATIIEQNGELPSGLNDSDWELCNNSLNNYDSIANLPCPKLSLPEPIK